MASDNKQFQISEPVIVELDPTRQGHPSILTMASPGIPKLSIV